MELQSVTDYKVYSTTFIIIWMRGNAAYIEILWLLRTYQICIPFALVVVNTINFSDTLY